MLYFLSLLGNVVQIWWLVIVVDEAVTEEVSLGGGGALISSEEISAEVPFPEFLGVLDTEGID